MSPLEEQASTCQVMAQKLEAQFTNMNHLLDTWMNCDQTDQSNHHIYYDVKKLIDNLNEQVDLYSQEVAEAELLEGLQEKGDVILN